MTSTQCSESANHMLKTYMLPASPMHVFVRQYKKLQFDREHEESYEEKRTMIGGVVRRMNLAIEQHTSMIYQRAMFEEFRHLLIEGMAYNVAEVERMMKYVTTHNKAVKRKNGVELCTRLQQMRTSRSLSACVDNSSTPGC